MSMKWPHQWWYLPVIPRFGQIGSQSNQIVQPVRGVVGGRPQQYELEEHQEWSTKEKGG